MKTPRYSLRMLFLLVTLAAMACGWITWQKQLAKERKQLVVHIRDVWGGRIWFQEIPYRHTQIYPRISWLYRKLIDDYDPGPIFLPDDCDEELVRESLRLLSGFDVYQAGKRSENPRTWHKLD